MHPFPSFTVPLGAFVVTAFLAACASTTVAVAPSPQAAVCNSTATALVLWAPRWRPDQKDVADREKAAAAGLQDFLRSSGCFAASELHREADAAQVVQASSAASGSGRFTKVVSVVVRELGPILKLGSSAALVEGGTEVVLEVAEYSLPAPAAPRTFTVHWRNGGPGVIKGVGTLATDMQAALVAGLQPAGALK